MPQLMLFERCLDSQLWHACAGSMVQMPPLNSKVLYFPQGHAEHAHGRVDFGNSRIPPFIPCRVSALRYMAEADTDEVFVKLGLTPLSHNELDLEDDCCFLEGHEKLASFAKTLTQSDANNGGGFSVPRYCAETIFPRLDYSADPPVQTIVAKDVHGQSWKFRHIYRGTPRRHLLTTGWSNFVSQKKLLAGDSIVFLRDTENGDLCVGIRRAKKVLFGSENSTEEASFSWNKIAAPLLLGEGESEVGRRVGAESVLEAVNCAVNGRPFEVVYYPRGSTPEFCVKASLVRDAMKVQWCSGMRFKMPFETEDSSRISWFMGTISSLQVADPIHWPDSPWRLLQVVWDEPDLLQNVKCVNPWLVELVPNIPTYTHHLSPFSPPRKKPRFLQNPEFNHINQIPMPAFSSNLLISHTTNNSLCNIQDNNSICADIQGARHAQFGLSPFDSPFNKLPSQSLHLPLRPPCGPNNKRSTTKNNLDISCLLTIGIGNSGHNLKDLTNEVKSTPPHILLFGKLIHTEQKSSNSSFCANGNSSSEGTLQKTSNANSDGMASSALHQDSPTENSSDGGSPWYKDQHKSDLRTENVNLLCLAL